MRHCKPQLHAGQIFLLFLGMNPHAPMFNALSTYDSTMGRKVFSQEVNRDWLREVTSRFPNKDAKPGGLRLALPGAGLSFGQHGKLKASPMLSHELKEQKDVNTILRLAK